MRTELSPVCTTGFVHCYVQGQNITCGLGYVKSKYQSLLLNLISLFRSNCRRPTIKTGKKDVRKLPCKHEAVVNLLTNNQPSTSSKSESECVKCKNHSISSINCPYCPLIKYCSRTCQVIGNKSPFVVDK